MNIRSFVALNALAMNRAKGSLVSPGEYQKFVKVSKELFPNDPARQTSFANELKDLQERRGEGEVKATIEYQRRERQKKLNERKSATQKATSLLAKGKAMSGEMVKMCSEALTIVAKLKSTRPQGLAPWDGEIDNMLSDLSTDSSRLLALINSIKIPVLNARGVVVDKAALASYQQTIDACVGVVRKICSAARKFGDFDGVTGMLQDLGVSTYDLDDCALRISDTATSLQSYISALSMTSKELKKLGQQISREERWD